MYVYKLTLRAATQVHGIEDMTRRKPITYWCSFDGAYALNLPSPETRLADAVPALSPHTGSLLRLSRGLRQDRLG